MRIGINTLDMLPGFGGGEEIFIRKVLEAVDQLESSAELVVLTDPLNHDSFKNYTCAQVSNPKQFSKVVQAEELDIVFSSQHNAPPKLPVPLVLLVMDLYDLEPGGQRKRFWGGGSAQRKLKDVCEQASVVVTPSEFIRRELLNKFTVPLNKVVVARMGVDPIFSETEQHCIVEKPFILAVGKVSQRKNLGRLREAFEKLQDEFEHTLVIVGQPSEEEPDQWGDRVFRIDRLGTTQLAGLYQHCDLFVHPSLYEGAGVTVLEALASGALVCSGRLGGIVEVAADAPMYFNPESVDSMVQVMTRALELDEDERDRRIQAGRMQCVENSWEDCSVKVFSAFRKAIAGI